MIKVVNLLHPAKVPFFIAIVPDGILKLSRFVHCIKAYAEIFVTVIGIVIFVALQRCIFLIAVTGIPSMASGTISEVGLFKMVDPGKELTNETSSPSSLCL